MDQVQRAVAVLGLEARRFSLAPTGSTEVQNEAEEMPGCRAMQSETKEALKNTAVR